VVEPLRSAEHDFPKSTRFRTSRTQLAYNLSDGIRAIGLPISAQRYMKDRFAEGSEDLRLAAVHVMTVSTSADAR